MDIKNVLNELGLTEGEIKVYLSLLDLGTVTVGAIIDKSNVSSSKVYILLEKLIQKGIVSYGLKEKTKYFHAEPPITLKMYLEKEHKRISDLGDNLTKVIKELEERREESHIPEEARIYRGYNGLKNAWSEAVKSIPNGGTYYFFSIGLGEDLYLKQLFKNIALELKERKIKIVGLAHEREKEIFRYYEKLGYKMKYISSRLPADTTIAGKYILILAWDKEEPVVYMLRSKVLVESYLSFIKQLII